MLNSRKLRRLRTSFDLPRFQLSVDDLFSLLSETFCANQCPISGLHLLHDVGRKWVSTLHRQSLYSCVAVVQDLLDRRSLSRILLNKNSVIGFVSKGFSEPGYKIVASQHAEYFWNDGS